MSIILDALRKSEAARRRNEAPELFAAMPTAAAPTRTQATWPLWAVGGIGVASLALALWLTMRANAPSDADAAATATDIETLSQDNDRALANAAMAAQTAANANANAMANAATNATPPVASTTPAVAVPPPSAPAMPTDVREQRIQTAPVVAPSLANTPSVVAPPQRETASNITAPVAASRQAVSSQALSPQPVQPPPTTFRSPQSDGPLALADLDSGTRKQLPPLKLSMHVWHDAPAQRFVILDGQRLREGDVLGDVVVERITRDGATLSWRGTALKVEWR
jgi:general secretion pathway protein B